MGSMDIKISNTADNQSGLGKFFDIKGPAQAKGKPDFDSKIVSLHMWNINGLRPVLAKKALQAFIEEHQPEVLGLNELKMTHEKLVKEKLETMIPEGYLKYWNYSVVKKGYSGTGILTKVKPIDVRYGIGIKKHDGEGRVITAEFEKFFFVVSYVPNSGRGLVRLSYRCDEWNKDFNAFLKSLEEEGKPVILAGDLNVAHKEIDLKNPKGNKKTPGFTDQERAGMDDMINEGWIDSFRYLHPEEVKYSFWSVVTGARAKNAGWRLDYNMISPSLKPALVESEILTEVMGSDHCPVRIDIDLSQIKSEGEEEKKEEEDEPKEAEKDESEDEE